MEDAMQITFPTVENLLSMCQENAMEIEQLKRQVLTLYTYLIQNNKLVIKDVQEKSMDDMDVCEYLK